ncbi:alpha/beta hydrolase [Nonomuraea sp. NPDC005692]|uniref:alpha/beta fold hydrolase n=1 Tax=Nonomuraea sp. NPDC005692 TaxID=3157168 RepID=UPI0033E7FC15
METLVVDGNPIDYDVTGTTGPTVVLVSGWCQDHRLFDHVLPFLAENHRVIRVDWRGHGAVRSVDADFGPAEQASDVIALMDALGVDRFIPISTSHGGWANMEIIDRMSLERVPGSVVIDWIMVEAWPQFIQDLRDIQDPALWIAGRQRLFDFWLGGTAHPAVARHLGDEMASFDFDMWARSCRVIESAYATWGSPLRRMTALSASRPIAHLFSQPSLPDYEAVQQEFAAANPWFQPHRIPGQTHFPTLESPSVLAGLVEKFVASVGR